MPSFDERSTSSSQNKVATSCNNADCNKAPRQQEHPTPFEPVQSASVYSGTQTLSNLVLPFSQEELCSYVDARIAGLARKSRDWIVRAAQMLWRISRGKISQASMEQLRSTILTHYTSAWSHGKMLNFANAFLKYLTKVRLDARYSGFQIFLEMPKLPKERKVVTARIVTQADITNVLTHVKRAEQAGSIDSTRARQYKAFVVFGAYTGQRSMATAANLTVGQLHNLTVKVRAEEAGNTAQVCTLTESAVSGVRFQLSKELEQSSRDKALTKAVKLAKEKAKLLAKSAGVELGTLQSLVDRAQSMTINAPVDTDHEILADAITTGSERSREPHYELNFAVRKISVYESVQLAYTTI